MSSDRRPLPVTVLSGDPCESTGVSGRGSQVFVAARRGTRATLLGFDAAALTVVGAVTWEAADVRDLYVRDDQRGIGCGLHRAACEVSAAWGWPDLAAAASNGHNDGQVEATGARPVPFIDLPGGLETAPASTGMPLSYLAVRQGDLATFVALTADAGHWVGSLTWMRERPGGRLGGPDAGRTVGEVRRVDTRAGFERRGIATRMYHTAPQVAADLGWPSEIDHSPDRTRSGDSWAQSPKVGGWCPPLTGGRHMPEPGDLLQLMQGKARRR